jgi:hypothetical protein
VGHKFNFEFVPLNRDDITVMSNEDIQHNIIKFKRMIREARTMNQDATQFEVEYCYLDHERQMRLKAEKFIKQNRRGDR